MDRLEELKNWFNTAPLGAKFPMQIDGLTHGFAEVSMDIQMGYLVATGEKMIVQGGVIAVIADAAAVLAAMSVLQSGHTPLAHISYDLLSPTTVGDKKLIAVAKVQAENSKLIWVEVRVYGAILQPQASDNFKAMVSAKFAKPKQT